MKLSESVGEQAPCITGVIWARDADRISKKLSNERLPNLANDLEIVALVELGTYPPSGQLRLVIKDIDVDSLKLIHRREIERIREALKKDGIYDANRSLEVSEVPLEIGLVTSLAGTVQYDFCRVLDESGFAFRVTQFDAPVTAATKAGELARAIRAAASKQPDLVVVIRGGGSESDLAIFDSEPVVRAVASSLCPVWCAIGHAADEVLTNEVANRSFKVPLDVAKELVSRVGNFLSVLAANRDRAVDLASRRLQTEREEVERISLSLYPATDLKLTEADRSLTKLNEILLSRAFDRIGGQRESLAGTLYQASIRANSYLDRINAELPSRQVVTRTALVNVTNEFASLLDLNRLFLRSVDLALTVSATSLPDWKRAKREAANRIGASDDWAHALGRLIDARDPFRLLVQGYSILKGSEGKWLRTRAEVREHHRIVSIMSDGEVPLIVEKEGRDGYS
jgi:exodeoxyribonuclease VII large subunit